MIGNDFNLEGPGNRARAAPRNLNSIMKPQLAREIIACLPKGRTHFRYFKDRYAFYLLAYATGRGRSISELKLSPVRRLLDKPSVKQLIARHGDNVINRSDLLNSWIEPSEPFVLGLGIWNGSSKHWRNAQISRRGANLVLQLNFTNQHQAEYYRLVKPRSTGYLNGYGHPVLRAGPGKFHRDTLAWARIDLDFGADEALIEEIQSDWIRYADWDLRPVLKCRYRARQCGLCKNIDGKKRDIAHYLEHTLKPYREIWIEAMLAATIEFIADELGIGAIYYHTQRSGAALKNIHSGYRQPPRSLYSDLPRKFCFQSTNRPPEFLGAGRHGAGKANKYPWYLLRVAAANTTS